MTLHGHHAARFRCNSEKAVVALEIKVTDWQSSQDTKGDPYRVVLLCLDVVVHGVHGVHGEVVWHEIYSRSFFRRLRRLRRLKVLISCYHFPLIGI